MENFDPLNIIKTATVTTSTNPAETTDLPSDQLDREAICWEVKKAGYLMEELNRYFRDGVVYPDTENLELIRCDYERIRAYLDYIDDAMNNIYRMLDE